MHLLQTTTKLQRLEEVLHKQACYETNKGLEARREALKNLNVLVSQWIQSISLNAGKDFRRFSQESHNSQSTKIKSRENLNL